MGRLIDLTNKRFGRLFVVERAGVKRGEAAWRCWCDCGNGNYEPGNCRWADAKTQRNNRRDSKRVAA